MKKTSSISRVSNGFSLIELIVVIAIIGLLSSIVIASLGQSRQKADVTRAKSDFRALSHALELYRQAHNNELPQSGDQGLTIKELVDTYLSSYISVVPGIPGRLISSPNVYYYTNPVQGSYYNCGSPDGQQDYFIYFVASQQAIDGNEFPQIYRRGVDTSPYETERCIAIEPN